MLVYSSVKFQAYYNYGQDWGLDCNQIVEGIASLMYNEILIEVWLVVKHGRDFIESLNRCSGLHWPENINYANLAIINPLEIHMLVSWVIGYPWKPPCRSLLLLVTSPFSGSRLGGALHPMLSGIQAALQAGLLHSVAKGARDVNKPGLRCPRR